MKVRTLVAMLSCALLLPTGCGGGDAPKKGDAAVSPDIVVLVLGGLRADRKGEKNGPESALIKAIGRKPSHRFLKAYAQSPRPFVSMGSMLTGRYPSAVPMCAPPWSDLDTNGRPWCVDIPDDRYTLPEVLGLYGYRTGLVHAGWAVPDSMEKNFQTTVDASDWLIDSKRLTPTGIQPMVDAAKNWWSQSADTPRFLMFAVGELTLGKSAGLGAVMTSDPKKEDHVPPLSESLMSDAELQWLRMERDARVQAGEYQNRKRLTKKYSRTAGEMGHFFGDLMDFIAEGDRDVRFLVVGSHGASFRDPSKSDNGTDFSNVQPSAILLEDSIHVPLLAYSNGRTFRTRKISDIVELIDVFPTAAAWSGAEAPAGLHASGLFPDKADPFPWAYSELGDMFTLRKKAYLFSFRGYSHHRTSLDPLMTELLVDAAVEGQKYAAPQPPPGALPGTVVPGQRGRPKYALFNIEDDPFQEHDISEEHEALTREYHQALIQIRQTMGAPAPEKMTEAAIRELRMTSASGYW